MNCETQACHIAFSYVVPSIGLCTALGMYLAPLPAVRRVCKDQDIGSLNPFPFAVNATNSISWIIYALLKQDYFIFFTNFMGYTLGTYETLSVLTYAPRRLQTRIIQTWLAITCTAFLTGIVCFAILPQTLPTTGASIANTLMGSINTAFLVLLYGAPLTTMYNVVKTRDSSSINLPLAVASIVNGGLWFIYGMTIGDPFVWAPNGAGAVMGVLQVVVKILFRGRRESDTDSIETVVAVESGDVDGWEKEHAV
ncbi:hypothetical protein HK097_004929 [Rhizophlyctis rosea]|uniref:Sugar transporter SWEET1 n=1 Tax=Rhizophlyctis rosea TaxID=64517 RepID=A0AAD5S2C8_9FUNG|nr:hypothetical protein HK097_004929 [Rhizophlyctis rosea]